jgi:hypothetical protein
MIIISAYVSSTATKSVGVALLLDAGYLYFGHKNDKMDVFCRKSLDLRRNFGANSEAVLESALSSIVENGSVGGDISFH